VARPERNNVDYFPFLCKEGKTMYYIEEKYRNDGFATWIKILRQLAVTDYHYLNLSNKVDVMFLSSKCKVSEDVLIAIINDLAEMGEFELNLWKESRVLFSVKFIDHISDAYLKRNNKCITLPGLLTLLDSLGVRKLGKSKPKGDVNPQSKVDYSKLEENKEDQMNGAGKPASLTIEDRSKNFMNKIAVHLEEYSKEMLREFYDYWTESNEGGRKMKFEMQKTFDIQKRLAKWASNQKTKPNGTTKNRRESPEELAEAWAKRVKQDFDSGVLSGNQPTTS